MIVVTGMPRPGPGLSIQGRLEYAMIFAIATGGSLQPTAFGLGTRTLAPAPHSESLWYLPDWGTIW